MSYAEARSHFEKAKLANRNKSMFGLLEGSNIRPTLSFVPRSLKRASEPRTERS
jgi:hypothetical protein